jgi:hypothetical protein
MDTPFIPYNALDTHGISQPVAAGTPLRPVGQESHTPRDSRTGTCRKKEKKRRNTEEQVEFSELAKLLATGRTPGRHP